MITENLPTLKIHKLTQEQYDRESAAGNLDEQAIYLTPEETYTAFTGAPTANQTPAFGGTFTVSQPISDDTGHVTAINSRTVTIPDAVVTAATNGLMLATDKTKLDGVAAGAEVNQNAFSNITIGSTTIAADAKTDTITLVAGSNVTITPDAANDKITISATDTVYTHPTYTSKSAGLYKITIDGTGHVSETAAVTKADITALGIPAQDTTYTLSSFGITTTAAELNYVDGVTSNIQTQINELKAQITELQALVVSEIAVYSGIDEPTSDIGEDGDLYIMEE